jgi:hypothetical protein
MIIYRWILLQWEMFQINIVEEMKIHILYSIRFFRKSCRLWDNVEKCDSARQATMTIYVIGRMRFACWITKATDTHSEYVILLVFHGNKGCTNAPRFNVYTYIACLVLFLRRPPRIQEWSWNISSKTRLYYVLIFTLTVKWTKIWHLTYPPGNVFTPG